jgi:uncharacterized protein (TIGR00251 family)
VGRVKRLKFRVKVVPNSKTEEVLAKGDILLVKVKEPPKEGKANKAVIKVLAKYFKVPQDSVRIENGFSSKNKVIEVIGL